MWHKELTSLQYPHLQEVGLFESECATSMNTADVLIHYAQANVTSFTIRQGSGTSDYFLERLHHSCAKLISLTINRISGSNVPKDELVRFLDRTDSLAVLDIRTGFDESWSYKVLHTITKYRRLECLRIPDIDDE
jgi:hypothetical protein